MLQIILIEKAFPEGTPFFLSIPVNKIEYFLKTGFERIDIFEKIKSDEK